jgi:hypothetical protein
MVSDCVVEIIINFHQQKKQLGEFTSYWKMVENVIPLLKIVGAQINKLINK